MEWTHSKPFSLVLFLQVCIKNINSLCYRLYTPLFMILIRTFSSIFSCFILWCHCRPRHHKSWNKRFIHNRRGKYLIVHTRANRYSYKTLIETLIETFSGFLLLEVDILCTIHLVYCSMNSIKPRLVLKHLSLKTSDFGRQLNLTASKLCY